jgi:hypothetical protein
VGRVAGRRSRPGKAAGRRRRRPGAHSHCAPPWPSCWRLLRPRARPRAPHTLPRDKTHCFTIEAARAHAGTRPLLALQAARAERLLPLCTPRAATAQAAGARARVRTPQGTTARRGWPHIVRGACHAAPRGALQRRSATFRLGVLEEDDGAKATSGVVLAAQEGGGGGAAPRKADLNVEGPVAVAAGGCQRQGARGGGRRLEWKPVPARAPQAAHWQDNTRRLPRPSGRRSVRAKPGAQAGRLGGGGGRGAPGAPPPHPPPGAPRGPARPPRWGRLPARLGSAHARVGKAVLPRGESSSSMAADDDGVNAASRMQRRAGRGTGGTKARVGGPRARADAHSAWAGGIGGSVGGAVAGGCGAQGVRCAARVRGAMGRQNSPYRRRAGRQMLALARGGPTRRVCRRSGARARTRSAF